MNDCSVNQRAQDVLKILIERYIRDGQPVGSRTLSEESQLPMSPATIRNVLADLEEAGLLISPHTSAGRVPTDQGFRVFVDSMLTVQPLEQAVVETIQHQIDPDLNTKGLVQATSSLLSGITELVGVVTLPKRNQVQLRRVEFLPLSGHRVLTILVLNEKEVQNRVIHTDREYSASELQEASNFINTHYVGKSLVSARDALLNAMQHDQSHMTGLMQTAIDVAEKAFDREGEQQDYVLDGHRHLLNSEDDTDLEHLRSLFDAFSRKQGILHLLDKALTTDGMQIFIGHESGHPALENCSVITSPYSENGEVVGVLGVIGPTRMSYDRVITVVDATSKLLTAALNQEK